MYLGGGGSTVYRLAPSGPAVPDPPALLSQTGAFADLATLQPGRRLHPVRDEQPAVERRGGQARRWMGVPNDGNANTAAEQITAAATGDWAFPTGTVFIKHFELTTSRRTAFASDRNPLFGPRHRRALLGRHLPLARRTAVTRTLLTTGMDEVINGQTWRYPSRSECQQCHNTTANQVLGLRTAQLNRPQYYPSTGATSNQLDTLGSLGLFATPLASSATLPAAKSVHTVTATLETRVKSYLSSNCAHCHRPGGQGRGTFDTQFDTTMASANIVDGLLADDLGIPNARVIAPQSLARSVMYQRMDAIGGAQMPPLARNVVDTDAVALFAAWIAAANTNPGPAAPIAQAQSVTVATGSSVVVTLSGVDADGDALDFAVQTGPGHGALSGIGPQLTYTPAAGFTGTDSFTFSAYDGGQQGASATVSITVTP